MKELVIVSGPTAAGKSSAAIELALRLPGEIISADSMQVYRGMDIGTAKLKKEEMKDVPHHMIDILDPSEDFNVACFKEYADRYIAEIRDRGRTPVIAGGTGFYTQAVLYGVDFKDGESDEKVRARLEQEAEEKGIGYIEEKLLREDPDSAVKYRGNLKRMLRALEYKELTGETLSEKNRREKDRKPAYDFMHFCLTLPRDILYERIDKRVDRMLEEGLPEEVRKLRDAGVGRDKNSMQALGYKQLMAFLEGEISYEEAVCRIKKETRHFAKRQMTWFNGRKDIVFINRNEFESDVETAEYMLKLIKSN